MSKNKQCPYCASPAKNKSVTVSNCYGGQQPSMIHFQCGTSIRPVDGWEKAIAGKNCSAYISAYPLPTHLAAIHCSEKKLTKDKK